MSQKRSTKPFILSGQTHVRPSTTTVPEPVPPGNTAAAADLLPLVYQELSNIAAQKLAGQAGHTLQPTALVHEAWLRLSGDGRKHFAGRAHRADASNFPVNGANRPHPIPR